MECESALQWYVIVEFVPINQCRELGSRERHKRAQVETTYRRYKNICN